MERIKVLMIAGSMSVGGIQNQLMHLLRQSDKTRFQIDFTSTEEHPFYQDEIESLGGHCIRIPATEGRHLLRYCIALYKVLKDGKYDIVHSNELFHSGIVLLTARFAGVKHRFAHAHNWMEGNDPNAKKSFMRRAYNFVMQKLIQWNGTDFVACSSLAGRFLYGERVTHRSNYHLVFNSVDTGKFIDRYEQAETGEFVDDGWIKEYSIEKEMMLLGVRKDVDALMRKSSAFLLPSLYEGMPLVLIEAQASGLPCICADTFSREVDFGIDTVSWLNLEDGVAAWADAIEDAVQKKRAPKQAVIAAIEKGGFDSRIFARKIFSLYEGCVRK